MARSPSLHPTELELEILKILWRQGEASVRQVRDALVPFRDLAYTSVMTTLAIMHKKKTVRRRPDGKAFLYAACVGEEETSRGMLSHLIRRVFDGSAKVLLVSLLGNEDLSRSDIEELRTLIDAKALRAAKGRRKGATK